MNNRHCYKPNTYFYVLPNSQKHTNVIENYDFRRIIFNKKNVIGYQNNKSYSYSGIINVYIELYQIPIY